MNQVFSLVAAPPILTGIAGGACLTFTGFAFGSAPHLVQDFTCTIGGAIAGEIIGSIGAYIVGRSILEERYKGVLVLGVFASGITGMGVGSTLGAVTSIGLSALFKNS